MLVLDSGMILPSNSHMGATYTHFVHLSLSMLNVHLAGQLSVGTYVFELSFPLKNERN